MPWGASCLSLRTADTCLVRKLFSTGIFLIVFSCWSPLGIIPLINESDEAIAGVKHRHTDTDTDTQTRLFPVSVSFRCSFVINHTVMSGWLVGTYLSRSLFVFLIDPLLLMTATATDYMYLPESDQMGLTNKTWISWKVEAPPTVHIDPHLVWSNLFTPLCGLKQGAVCGGDAKSFDKTGLHVIQVIHIYFGHNCLRPTVRSTL